MRVESNARGRVSTENISKSPAEAMRGESNARGHVSPEIISKSRESRTNARAKATRPRRAGISLGPVSSPMDIFLFSRTSAPHGF
jgi:hypothetical protein